MGVYVLCSQNEDDCIHNLFVCHHLICHWRPYFSPPPLSQGVDSFQREVTKREAQRAAAAPAPGDPDDNLPPCPGGGGSSSCYTERGQLCQFPFSYNGKTYYECTTDSSNNGKA